MLGSLAGKQLSLTETHRFPNRPVRLPDGLHWDVLRLWVEIKAGIAATVVSHLMASGEITGTPGEQLPAGKLGERTIVDDGAGGGMVLLGPPFKFNADNIDDWKDVY